MVRGQELPRNPQKLFAGTRALGRIFGCLVGSFLRFFVENLLREFAGPNRIAFGNRCDDPIAVINSLHAEPSIVGIPGPLLFEIACGNFKSIAECRTRFVRLKWPDDVRGAQQDGDPLNVTINRLTQVNLPLNGVERGVARAGGCRCRRRLRFVLGSNVWG